MPSISGCRGTVKYGVSKDEVLGVKMWTHEESANIGEYADNTTNCAAGKIPGRKTANGTFDVNVQITSGPPFRAGDEIELELHLDDTGYNYIAGTAFVSSLGVSCNIEDGSEVPNYNVSFEWDGLPTFNGSLEPPT